MARNLDPLTKGVLGHGRDESYAATPQQGTVLTVTPAGITFVLDGIPLTAWGPAPWPIGSHDTPAAAITAGFCPRIGDRLLAVFTGADHTPWVIGWWR